MSPLDKTSCQSCSRRERKSELRSDGKLKHAPPRLVDGLRRQLDVLLACRLAFGVLLDPGFPAASVGHIAAGKRKSSHLGVLDRDPGAGGLGEDARGGSRRVAIEDVAFDGLAVMEG